MMEQISKPSTSEEDNLSHVTAPPIRIPGIHVGNGTTGSLKSSVPGIGTPTAIPTNSPTTAKELIESDNQAIEELVTLMKSSTLPLLLVGGGLDFSHFKKLWPEIETLNIPVATTWNAADYLDSSHDLYAGRPNTYGMRWANTVIQQSDLLITFGARLGLQQTGFAWQEFVPEGKIIRIELDEKEIALKQPQTYLDIHMDAGKALSLMLAQISKINLKIDILIF